MERIKYEFFGGRPLYEFAEIEYENSLNSLPPKNSNILNISYNAFFYFIFSFFNFQSFQTFRSNYYNLSLPFTDCTKNFLPAVRRRFKIFFKRSVYISFLQGDLMAKTTVRPGNTHAVYHM